MVALSLKPWHRLGCTLLAVLCVQSAYAQDKAAPMAPAPAAAAPAPAAAPPAVATPVMPAPMPEPAAMTAPAKGAPDKPAAEAPKKRHYVARRPRSSCTLLDDPWDNLCMIQKKAEVACSDLSVGKRRAAMRHKRGQMPPPMVVGNPRKECVDAYMRNV